MIANYSKGYKKLINSSLPPTHRVNLSRTFTTKYPPPTQRHTEQELDDAIELLIPSADGTTERILVNTRADGSFMHKNSWQTIGSLRTDAFIVYQKRNKDEKLLAAGMINGSRLRIGDEFAVGSLLKFDGFFDLSTRTAHVQTSMETEIAIDTEDESNIKVAKGDSVVSF